MSRAFLLSLRLHLLWFFEAIGRNGRSIVPLTPRRLAVLLLLGPVYLLLQGAHWLGFLADELLFRRYRRVVVKEPLFITGIPRSGTTFVHRTLSRETDRFTTFSTWEALLAPSITERKLIRGLSRLDKAIGGPVHRLLEAATRRLTGTFSHIHEVGLGAPEEDYLTLLPAAGCFILVLAFPASPSLWRLGRFQEMPDEQREILVTFYKRCLQKHLYVHGIGKRLLSKNAAFASWMPDLRFTFPDARYIVCIRQPRAALASQLSSLRSGLEFFGTLAAADTFSLQFQTVFAHAYRILLEEQRSFLIDHLALIEQSRLREQTGSILRGTLHQLGIPVSPALQAAIEEAERESRERPSHHHHKPLAAKSGPGEFDSLIAKVYEELLLYPSPTRNDRSRKA